MGLVWYARIAPNKTSLGKTLKLFGFQTRHSLQERRPKTLNCNSCNIRCSCYKNGYTAGSWAPQKKIHQRRSAIVNDGEYFAQEARLSDVFLPRNDKRGVYQTALIAGPRARECRSITIERGNFHMRLSINMTY